MKSILAICSLVFLFVSTPSVSADSIIQEKAFADSLGRALNKTREFEGYDYAGWNRVDVHGTGVERLNTPNAQGSWRMNLRGHFDIAGYGMKTVLSNSGVAVVTNYGNRYEYVLLTQALQPRFFDKVYAKLGERLETMKDSDDAPQNLAWQRQENAILVGASHQWNGKANVVTLEKQLISLMHHSKKLIGEIIEKEFIVRTTLRDELEDKTFTRMDRLEFEILVDNEDWSQWYQGVQNAVVGSYSFSIDEHPYEFRNHGDRLEYIVELEIPENAGINASGLMLEDIGKWARSEGAEGDPQISARWKEDAEIETVHLVLNYRLAGGIEGESVGEWYKELYKDFGPDAHEAFANIVEKHLEEQSALAEKKPDRLDRQAFISIIDDGLDKLEGETEDPTNLYGIEGGVWDFNVGELSFIVVNAGDKMVLWHAVQLPALGDVTQILDAVKKFVGNRVPKNADKLNVAWMPGLEENWFYIGAIYNYGGSKSGGEIQDGYNDFIYDWIKNDISPKVQKVFGDFGN